MAAKQSLAEKDLHALWRHSRYFDQPLLTATGRQLEVIRRGSYNLDGGPDFLDAVLKVDGRMLEGDVEIHIDARDWLAHGHDRDPAYNNVILHLALQPPMPLTNLRCENGRMPLQFQLPDDILPAKRFPADRPQKTLPLQFCPLSEKSRERITHTVQQAGRARLTQKVQRFREQVQTISWDQLLYSGICEALGYAKNQQPFRRLAELVPIDLIFAELRNIKADEQEPEVVLSALLFGAAGLLQAPESGTPDAAVQQYLVPRQQIWQRLRHPLQIQPMPEGSWQFFRLRPQNFPTRRLAAVVQLILRFYRLGMLETLIGCVQHPKQSIKQTVRELRDFFTVPADSFWEFYYDFKSRKPGEMTASLGGLLGEKRADDLIVNVVLPVLALFARETSSAALDNRLQEIFAAYPALQENQITRKMQEQLFAEHRHLLRQLNKARFQQGLIHLHKNYCHPLRCDDCLALGEKG